jgi:hypothetical protein
MEEERQRRIFGILEDLLSECLKAQRKFILDALAAQRKFILDVLAEELGQLNAMIDDVRRDLRQVQQAGSLPATPAGAS